MALKKTKFMFVYNEIENIFLDTLKEVFINKYSCEDVELHYLFISEGNFFFDGKKNTIKPENITVNDFLNRKFNNKMYILIESKVLLLYKKKKHKIYWIFFSEYLTANRGRFFLNCIFEQLAKAFDNYLAGFEDERGNNSPVKIDNPTSLVQSILQSAEEEVCFHLESMFYPFNVRFINSLSGEYYEKSECQSNMAFLSNTSVKCLDENNLIYNFQNLEDEIEFIPSKNRIIRKLLQISQNDLWLIMGENSVKKTFEVLGICKEEVLNCTQGIMPCIKVKISKHMNWDLFLGGVYIFTYKNGQYKIGSPLEINYLKQKLIDYFGKRGCDYKALVDNIIISTTQRHGTMLVIMKEKDAKAEAERLGNLKYGFPDAKPQKHTNEEMNHLNAIDGSVIIDTGGKIHGIGVILDGPSTTKGDLATGARHNSAKKYIKYLRNKRKKGMIVIISEDGSIDIKLS